MEGRLEDDRRLAEKRKQRLRKFEQRGECIDSFMCTRGFSFPGIKIMI